MQPFPIHWAAVLVAALIRIVIGFVWYSPMLFFRPWKEVVNIPEEQMKAGMARSILLHAIGSVVMAFVLLHAVHYAGARGLGQGAAVGFFNWLGFIFITQLDTVIAEKRPFRFFAINTGAALISLLLMGALLATWV